MFQGNKKSFVVIKQNLAILKQNFVAVNLPCAWVFMEGRVSRGGGTHDPWILCDNFPPPRFSSGVTVVQDFPSSSCFGGGPSNFTLDFWFPLSLLLLPLCIPGSFLHVFTRLVLQSSPPAPWGASRSCSHYPGLFTILLLPVVFPTSLLLLCLG